MNLAQSIFIIATRMITRMATEANPPKTPPDLKISFTKE